jgi:hypothetical protein
MTSLCAYLSSLYIWANNMLIIDVDVVSSTTYGEWPFLHIVSQLHQSIIQLLILKNGHHIALTSSTSSLYK